MGIITPTIPEAGVGITDEVAEAQVTDALKVIRDVINGNLDADNLSAELRNTATIPVVSSMPHMGNSFDGMTVDYNTGVGNAVWRLRRRGNFWEWRGGEEVWTDQNVSVAVGANSSVRNLAWLTTPFSGTYRISGSVQASNPGGSVFTAGFENGVTQVALLQMGRSPFSASRTGGTNGTAGQSIAIYVTTGSSAITIQSIGLAIRPIRFPVAPAP